MGSELHYPIEGVMLGLAGLCVFVALLYGLMQLIDPWTKKKDDAVRRLDEERRRVADEQQALEDERRRNGW